MDCSQIAKAVELEVARRLEEREEAARKERSMSVLHEEHGSASAGSLQSLPPGLLSPLFKKQRHSADDELKQRLEELESKLYVPFLPLYVLWARANANTRPSSERGDKDKRMSDVLLSPLSRKKTGRAYVALARAHTQKNNLQVALELYRKAETYVPDNVKLKERWILFLANVFECMVTHEARR